MFSLYVLALYVFLQSASSDALNWIEKAPKLTALVGILFVFIVLVEVILWNAHKLPSWHPLRKREA